LRSFLARCEEIVLCGKAQIGCSANASANDALIDARNCFLLLSLSERHNHDDDDVGVPQVYFNTARKYHLHIN
jgi:hypothetical protein